MIDTHNNYHVHNIMQTMGQLVFNEEYNIGIIII